MILTREIEIKINESNYQYYDDLGYDVAIGEVIKIPIELMSKGSHYKIKCKCDGCGVEKEVIFKKDLELIFGSRPFEKETIVKEDESKIENSSETLE